MKKGRESKVTIISLGGSLIVPNAIDTKFLGAFAKLLRKHIARGMKFVVIAGGGKTARHYQDAAAALHTLNRDDLDWLGIHATRLNGHLIRTIFRKEANPQMIHDPRLKVSMSHPIVVAAGWKPGWSTDYVAVRLAKNIGAKRVINLSNVDFAYTKDPRKFKNAKAIRKTNWRQFRKILPKKWDPGISAPFDPIAAKEAEAYGLEIAIINGKKLGEVDKYLRGKKFRGTVIS